MAGIALISAGSLTCPVLGQVALQSGRVKDALALASHFADEALALSLGLKFYLGPLTVSDDAMHVVSWRNSLPGLNLLCAGASVENLRRKNIALRLLLEELRACGQLLHSFHLRARAVNELRFQRLLESS